MNIKKVKIGDDVWIDRGAAILKGVTIQNGVVIGANSVVAKDIPSYAAWVVFRRDFLRCENKYVNISLK